MAYNNLYDGSSAYKIEEYYQYNKKTQEKQDESRAASKAESNRRVFVVSTVFLWTNAVLLQTSAQVSELTNELEDVKARNTQIAFEISSGIDLEDVKEKAVNEYHMQKPESHQNEYVDVVQSDYTKVVSAENGETGFIEDAIKALKSFLAYIG